MCYAIPSNLRILETNGDGNADRLYFGDLGGQLWRVDFDDVTKSDDYNVRLLADVSASGYQPFYYPPSVSLQAGSKNNFYAVTIESGNRDNPWQIYPRVRCTCYETKSITLIRLTL